METMSDSPPTTDTDAVAAFTDQGGQTWSTRITVNTIRRVKERLPEVDLLDVFEGDVLDRLANDPILLVNTLFVVCQPQAEENAVSEEDFGELLCGDAIADAVSALVQGIADFFPQDRRAVLLKIWNATEDGTAQTIQMFSDRLDSPQVKTAITKMIEEEGQKFDQRLSSLGSSSGNSQAS